MGILARFKEIMAANINALLDRAEDPEKMIDQYLRNLENDLASVKAETASVMADEKAAKRKLDECNEEIAKMTSFATKAVEAGNDEDARQFLAKRVELTERAETLTKNYELCAQNAAKMREMHAKLESDITTLKSKRDTLKAKAKVAETQKRINELSSAADKAGANIAAFNKMEERINKMVDEAEAMEELNEVHANSDISSLEKKYKGSAADSATVDDELAALKASLGM